MNPQVAFMIAGALALAGCIQVRILPSDWKVFMGAWFGVAVILFIAIGLQAL